MNQTMKALLFLVISTLFGFQIILLISPFMVILLFIFWSASILSFLLTKMLYSCQVHRPEAMDILNGSETDVSRPYISVFARFDGVCNIENIKNRFQAKLFNATDSEIQKKYRKFTQIFFKSGGYYLFKDVNNFDISEHIRLLSLEELSCVSRSKSDILNTSKFPGVELHIRDTEKLKEKSVNLSPGLSWEYLVQLLAQLYASRPIESHRPKWEIVIVRESDKRFTALFRVHHSIIDGINFIRLAMEILSDRPARLSLPFNLKPLSLPKKIALGLVSLCNLPFKLLNVIATNSDKNCLHGPVLTGNKIYRLSEGVPLQKFREIKKPAESSVNDVIFSCVSKAVSLHFESRSSERSSISCYLAISLHGYNKPVKLKNNFAVNFVRLPTKPDGDLKPLLKTTPMRTNSSLLLSEKFPSLSRLSVVKGSLQAAREDPSITALQWLLRCVASTMPSFLSDSILSSKGVTIDISNLIGPQSDSLEICGSLASDICFLLPDRDPLGIAVSILSYKGMLRFGLSVDDALMSPYEVTDFMRYILDEVENLHSEANLLESLKKKSSQDIPSSYITIDI